MSIVEQSHRGAVIAAPPGPRGYPIVGVIPMIGKDILGFFMRMTEDYGDIVRLKLGPKTFYLVNHPDGLKQVLQDNNRNYRKGYDQAKPLIGEGLVSSEGEFWRRQRRLVQPLFHRRRIGGFAETMIASSYEQLQGWSEMVGQSQPIDLAAEMSRLTQKIIAKTMFSTDVGDQTDALLEAFDIGLQYFNQQLFNPIPFLDRLPTPTNIRFRRALKLLDGVMFDLIEERKRAPVERDDLLGLLLKVRDADTGEGMSDQQIRDEVLTIFFAGHETTAATLAWAWYLLANHPDAAKRLYQEVDRVLGDRRPTPEDYEALQYTRGVIQESMRLFPPAWMFARQAIEPDIICGYHIPAGAALFLCPYTTHRHPDFWDRPNEFDPTRFEPAVSQDRHRMAYVPFGAGPRLCIGRDFSLLEGTLILAITAQQFSLALASGAEVQAQPVATLKPRPAVWMAARSRRGPAQEAASWEDEVG